ncbi:MAG TPA: hypothetical protein VFN10_11945, partial [Thermoanaerobaculia bacterium]|nr:hypothetical protein [Thermoanaerobaculia bacterium]
PPQSFRLVAELEGFQSSSVAFNEPVPSGAAIELTLRLSAVSESITVTAAGPAYQDDAAGVDSPPPVPSLQTPLQSTDELLNAIARETIDEDDEGDEALAATVAAKRHELRGRVLERMRGMTSPTERLRYYLTARAVLGGDKGFHFLAAQSMHDLAPDLAVRMLTDLAEARNADAPMLRLLARLLDSWDEPSLARLLLQRAIELAPNEPQSVREMLLLEARAGRPAHVDSWRTRLNATSKKQRDEWGMKELFEQTDEMLARWQKTSWLDRQRGVDLRDGGEDVDVLVELMFDTGWSWVDIHVKEPGGEIVKWDHTESAAGATFTGGYIFGYGPEIYSIRNAPHGTYQIDLDYYASDRVNPSLETLAHVIVYKRTSRGHTERKDYFMVLTDDTEHRELAKVEY